MMSQEKEGLLHLYLMLRYDVVWGKGNRKRRVKRSPSTVHCKLFTVPSKALARLLAPSLKMSTGHFLYARSSCSLFPVPSFPLSVPHLLLIFLKQWYGFSIIFFHLLSTSSLMKYMIEDYFFMSLILPY